MAKISKSILVLFVVLICIVLLAGHSTRPTVAAQPQQAPKAKEPHKNTCVLVEAFVVEVELPELYEQGVSPIGQKPNSVSVNNILKCILRFIPGRLYAHLVPSFSRFAMEYPVASILPFFGL